MNEQETLMRMLADDVPVTLLIDLLVPPTARELYEREGGRADWLPAATAAA